ncbi:PAS domain-containing protein [Belnapia sp. T6]|uniref:histidine kinase n=1 Tax=Belnapia mucosa TaxID=2804532 RepID=A0ABS1UZG7_9PROT|nr:PAS domain-containing protein [Belnapia mucosa]MBL6454844.1 PAS domain-containing protein [Belnapia mucosa]
MARNIALELDRELAGFGGTLRSLATSPALQDDDLRRFDWQARQVVPEGGAIVMRDRSGQQVVNTLFPFGTPLPVTRAPAVLATDECVFRTRSTCVSDLYTGTTDPQPYILLDAPVLRDGEVAFALNIAFRARHLATLLDRHRLPAGWGVSILDRRDRIVARAPDHDRFVGSFANAALREASAEEGTVRSVNVAGIPVWGAYVRLPNWGWRVAIGVPEAVLDAPLWRSALFFGAAGLLAVGASLAAALVYGRRLARPIRALALAAAEVGAAPVPGPSSIRELDQVAASLAAGEERLRLAQEAGRIGTWELDPKTGRTVVSLSQARLYGMPAEAAPHGFGWDAWLACVHPEDRARAEAVAHAAVTSGTAYEDEFRILRADTGELRWMHARGLWSAHRADGGRFVGVHIDITEAKAGEAMLAASEAEFRAIFENSVVGKAQNDPATLRFIRVNRALCEMLGYEESELLGGMTFLDVTHPEDRPRNETGFREAMAEGRPFLVEKRLLRKDGGLRWVIESVVLLPQVPGRPARSIATLQDITERRLGEERQALLAREVDHRAKNALAVVQAAIRLTPKEDATAFARAIEGRIGALARAQTLLAKRRWDGADLAMLVEGELAAFVGGEGPEPRMRLAGPPVLVAAEAAQPLAMALHELATNATKYGALSVPGGLVSVTWSLDPGEGVLVLDWVETGGPALPEPPRRRGFGSSVIEATLRQLGGQARLDWREGGLACRLRAPLSRLLAGRRNGATSHEMAGSARYRL